MRVGLVVSYLTVLLDVLLGALEGDLTDLLAVDLVSSGLGGALGLHLLERATLLEDRLRDETVKSNQTDTQQTLGRDA